MSHLVQGANIIMGELDINDFPLEVILAAVAIVLLVLFILIISLWVKLRKLRRSYTKLLNGHEGANMEQLLIQMQDQIHQAQADAGRANESIRLMKEEMGDMKANVGLVRYNAYGDVGSDLSFSLAITDHKQNGIVVSGLHNRDQTFVYAKPLTEGQSAYALSPEEKEAISRSVRKA